MNNKILDIQCPLSELRLIFVTRQELSLLCLHSL